MDLRKKILIVDDSEMNRFLLKYMLSNDFDVIEAENGKEAMTILSSQFHEICLMLLDIVMPVMDGFELLDIMNKNGWIKQVPVIMITAETVSTYVDRAFDLGVLDFISRPFDVRIVQRRVANTITLVAKRSELARMLVNQVYEKEKDTRLMIDILSNLVEFRNGGGGLHILHVQVFTEHLLKRLLLKTDKYPISHRDISVICNAAALHDIGKISIPPEILNKPGRLTDEEFEIMKTHSAEGARILNSVPLREIDPLIQYGYQICRWHHERYDGRGYPDGLKGEEIPISAQVVALADVYDALTSKRAYKNAFAHDRAIQMILDGQCGTFNPLLLECLTDISDLLKKETSDTSSTGQRSERELLDSAEQMMEMSKIDVSEKSLRLLEHERMKYQFFAALSKEIQFEYMAAVPEMVVLSEWGAKYLNMPESILNPREEAFGKEVFSREDFADLLQRLRETTPEDPIVEKKYLLNINGRQRWNKVICRSTWVEKETPEYTGAIGKIVDCQDEMEQMKEIQEQSDRDPLTGLLNHQAAKRHIAPLLENGEGQYALLFFDVDGFKQVNDQHGHLFGDEILKIVAERMKKSVRSGDIAARMGGDEFVVFAKYRNTVEPLVKRLFSKVTALYKNFPVKISMGVACLDGSGSVKDYDVLFKMADEAAYEVKRDGGNNYRFYGGKVI